MSDRRDPTRSAGLRRRGRAIVARKVFSLNRSMRQVMVEQDVAGLRAKEPQLPDNIILWIESQQNRLARSEMVLRQVVGREISDQANWLWNLMAGAVRLGVEQAAKELKVNLSQLDDADVADTHGYAATAEVIGIAQETERRLIRHAVKAVQANWSPEELMREIRTTLEKITKLRLNLLVNTGVVSAVNSGKLLAYRAEGVTQVGIDPEWLPPLKPRLHDHRMVHDKRKGTLVVQVVEELIQAIQQEEKAVSLVNILTAGDDRVCDDCDEIAAAGPYEIDEAQDIIPAHPNCRCAFVPWGDKRFAPIVEQEEE